MTGRSCSVSTCEGDCSNHKREIITSSAMKKIISVFSATILCLGLLPASAQFGKPGSGMDNALTQVFGTNLNFSATMNIQVKMPGAQDNEMTMGGKIYFANGNSRTEMDMTKIQGSKIPPHAVEQMRQ